MGDQTGFSSVSVSARDGLRLHVRDYSPADVAAQRLPVICLAGLSRNSADFHDLAVALATDPTDPRRVIAPDYRGRGRSEFDPDWKNYDVRTELDDVLQVMAATGVQEAVFVGTSRGGLITMALAPVRPSAIRGVVLNDIGPVLDAQGLIRIRGYLGKLPQPRSWPEASDIVRQHFASQFPILDAGEWDGYARRTWKEVDGKLLPDHDLALMKTLDVLDLEAPLPVMWPLYEGLRHAPVLVLRGENSDLLSDVTLLGMSRRHPACETFTVPGQGHAPLLAGKDIIGRIARLCQRADSVG